ncbi:MAG TPA: phosphate ABC transporter permease subunit PstC [Chloroflexota bacterium]|nr:phosphate ABC transporter permease subunit PstC [Chloroflexota bacterium]
MSAAVTRSLGVRNQRLRAGVSNLPDKLFRSLTAVCGALLLGVIVLIAVEMIGESQLSFRAFGWHFLWSTAWDPVKKEFGALPFIYGTVVTSFLALLVATPISVGVAIFIVELAPPWLGNAVSAVVELLAGIPSVLIGLWGIFVMVPVIQRGIGPALTDRFPDFPLFQGPVYGVSLLAGAMILGIMVIPTLVAITRDVMLTVPTAQREGMLALGATDWEAIKGTVLPWARYGILGAVMLALGRALGETMAVTMVIGNKPAISASLLQPSYTMASVIANEFTEATYQLYVSALIEVGLVLFLVTVIMNGLARLLVWSTARASASLG